MMVEAATERRAPSEQGLVTLDAPGHRPVLEMLRISKRFGATQALEDVSLALLRGEIHALLGENGAGKSTLIKIMTGIHRPDRGQILLEGKPIAIHNSVDAQRHGVAAIHQEPMSFPDLNVAENIFISHVPNSILGGLFLDWGRMYQKAEELLAQLDIKLDVRSQARGLTLAQQQAVEIAKAISLKVRVLIMDEPTASLSAHEVDQLFKLARRLRQQRRAAYQQAQVNIDGRLHPAGQGEGAEFDGAHFVERSIERGERLAAGCASAEKRARLRCSPLGATCVDGVAQRQRHAVAVA